MSNKRKLGSILGICGATVVASGGSAFLTNTGMSLLDQDKQIVAETESAEEKETELPITVEQFAKTKDSFVVSLQSAKEKSETGDASAASGDSSTTDSANTMYSTGNVNIRSGADADSDLLGTLAEGDAVTVTGNEQDGWTEVSYNGQTGYISSNLLTKSNASGSTSSGNTGSSSGSTSGSTSSGSTDSSSSGGSTSGSTSSGSTDGSSSGSSSSGSSSSSAPTWNTTASSGTMYVLTDANVRSGPGKEYTQFGGLSAGSTISITGTTDNGWVQISYDGQTGYVAGNLLSWDKPSSGNSGSSSSSGTDDSYMMYDINQRYISADELSDWSSSSLAKLRNEIFARHGRIFTTKEWQDYFATKSWYVPTYDASYFDENMSSFLNDYEQANLKVILKLEG